MAEYELYCFAQSGNSYRVALMLNLIGADSETGLRAEPTIADLSLIAYLYYPPEEFGFDIAAEHKNIATWLDRIKALPGWAHPHDLMPGYPMPA